MVLEHPTGMVTPPIPWAAYAIAQLSFGGEIIPNIQPGSS